jgi:P27 family predicted phage terminase small subunit
MARRGPPPQPTTLRLLKGNPGKRSINTREPRPPTATPPCPRWLSREAKRAWRETVPVLKGMRILTRIDRDALAAYCQTYARWKAAELFLDQHGEVYPLRDEKGNVRCMQQFPQVSIARGSLQILRSYQQEFGMTPSARTRVYEIPGFARDPEDERFFGPH